MQQPQPANSVDAPAGDTADQSTTLTLLAPPAHSFRWYHKVAAVMTAIFCFELGVFLLIYPWLNHWDANGALIPLWGRHIWTSSWVRGAVSGLGLLDIYISFVEVFRLRRFSA